MGYTWNRAEKFFLGGFPYLLLLLHDMAGSSRKCIPDVILFALHLSCLAILISFRDIVPTNRGNSDTAHKG